MHLRPSEIYYSQDSINNYFDSQGKHSGISIGETLDKICEGRCSIDSIPTITVGKIGGKWVTEDNRRLWVFKELERLGKCETVPVHVGCSIPSAKLTTSNDGFSIDVRGSPGGIWYTKPGSGISHEYEVVEKRSRSEFDDCDFDLDFDRFTLDDDSDYYYDSD